MCNRLTGAADFDAAEECHHLNGGREGRTGRRGTGCPASTYSSLKVFNEGRPARTVTLAGGATSAPATDECCRSILSITPLAVPTVGLLAVVTRTCCRECQSPLSRS